jgi:hypothetical protein
MSTSRFFVAAAMALTATGVGAGVADAAPAKPAEAAAPASFTLAMTSSNKCVERLGVWPTQAWGICGQVFGEGNYIQKVVVTVSAPTNSWWGGRVFAEAHTWLLLGAKSMQRAHISPPGSAIDLDFGIGDIPQTFTTTLYFNTRFTHRGSYTIGVLNASNSPTKYHGQVKGNFFAG